jgi:hypothetical protein
MESTHNELQWDTAVAVPNLLLGVIYSLPTQWADRGGKVIFPTFAV